jgi:hypothetical protein
VAIDGLIMLTPVLKNTIERNKYIQQGHVFVLEHKRNVQVHGHFGYSQRRSQFEWGHRRISWKL